MFRQIRLQDRAVDNEKAIEIIAKGSYGVLSTIGEDGYPYGVPLNYTYADYLKAGSNYMKKHWNDTKVIKMKIFKKYFTAQTAK